MFFTNILDVVTGVIFTFLAISLISSTILEAISSVLDWRANNLLDGVKQLVNDPGFKGLALRLYQHAAINPLGMLTSATLTANRDAVDLGKKPAYIASGQFATAMTDVLRLSDPDVRAGLPDVSVPAMKGAVDTALMPDNPQLATMIKGIVDRSNGDLKQIEATLAAWFDNGMDRLSGAYKRRTQLVSFAIALLLAGFLNVDTVRIARVLWDRPTLVDNLKLPPDAASKLCPTAGSAQNAAASSNSVEPPTAPGPDGSRVENCRLSANAEEALGVLDQYLPVGWWNTSAVSPHTPGEWLLALVGWLITAFATLFGAPFWFDALQSFVRLKGTGPSPKESANNRAAAA